MKKLIFSTVDSKTVPLAGASSFDQHWVVETRIWYSPRDGKEGAVTTHTRIPAPEKNIPELKRYLGPNWPPHFEGSKGHTVTNLNWVIQNQHPQPRDQI
jgi:hypothetical protein